MKKKRRPDMAVLGPSKNTRPERLVRMWLVRQGLSFRCHAPIYGTRCSVDFLITAPGRGQPLAVFVDGRFWHDPSHRTAGMSRFWREKVLANAARDRLNMGRCRRLGYRVTRIWDDDPPLQWRARLSRLLGLRAAP